MANDSGEWTDVEEKEGEWKDASPRPEGSPDPAKFAANPPNPISKESNIITKGPEAQGQDLMANLSGHSKYPGTEQGAQKQLRETTAGYAGAVAPMYVPGPSKGNLLMQAGKGALIGAGLGAGERAVTRAGQGQLPDLKGTAKAAGTGAAIGAVLSPLSEVPSINKYMRGTRLGKWLMPEAGGVYGEMERSAQYRDMGRDAMKGYRQGYAGVESPATGTAGASTGRPSGVDVLPEPREPKDWERPGSAWSVKRTTRPDLMTRGMRGEPGAAQVISQVQGKPVILTPREGIGYPGACPNITLNTDNLGVRWASSPISPNPISIPKSIPENEVQAYATQKLREQAEMAANIKRKQ